MKFLKEEVETVAQWRHDVVEEIASVISDMLDSETTTLEQDNALAADIFDRLVKNGRLEMPDGKVGLSAGGVIPRIPETSYGSQGGIA